MKDLTLKFDSQHFIDSLIKLKNSNWKNKFDFIERPYTIPSIGLIKHPRKNVSAATDGVEGWRAHTTIYSLIKKKVAKVDPGFPLWAIVYHRVNKIYRSSVSLSFSSMGENAKRWKQQHTAQQHKASLCVIYAVVYQEGGSSCWSGEIYDFRYSAASTARLDIQSRPRLTFFSLFSWPFKLFAGVPDFWCDMLLM
jgi:hypothetical protein